MIKNENIGGYEKIIKKLLKKTKNFFMYDKKKNIKKQWNNRIEIIVKL